MLGVYRFTGFPRSLGFMVGSDETIDEAVTNALKDWAKDEVTKHNLDAYLSSGQITQVTQFPDTDEGWEKAFELKEDITTY